MNNKEKYWKYSLLVIVIFLGFIILKESLPFLPGLLGALTIYILIRKQMIFLTEKKKTKNSIAALMIITEIILCFIIPAYLVFWLLINKLQAFDLNPNSLISTTQHLISLIQEKTGYDLINEDNITTIASYTTQIIQTILGELSFFIVNSLMLLFLLYFMLCGRKNMESYIYDILPFNDNYKKDIINEINIIVKSNAIGIPLLALIQGVIALIGYIIFGVPSPFVFAFLTCFATVIPIVGTAFIWFPLSVYLYLTGNTIEGIGLAIYSLIIISNIDNLIRFVLQKKLADIHPLITIFGVIIGLTLFGFWGVVFGPLLISIFLLCFNIFKKEYLDNKKSDG